MKHSDKSTKEEKEIQEQEQESGAQTAVPELFSKSTVEQEKRAAKRSPAVFAVAIALFVLLIAALTEYYLGDPLGVFGFLPKAASSDEQQALYYGTVDIYVLPLGEADCSIVTYSDGTCMVIDSGRESDYDTVAGELSALGLTKIDVLVATGTADYRCGGMKALLQNYEVGRFVCSAHEGTGILQEVVSLCREKSVPVQEVSILPSDSGPVSIPFSGDVEVIALSPFSGTYDSDNDYSLILRVKIGETSMLFTGDATQSAERIAIKALHNHYFHANIVMLGNHGSSSSTSDKLLSISNATIAVASCGESGPADSVIKMIRSYDMNLYRTDRDGLLHLRLDGENASVVE